MNKVTPLEDRVLLSSVVEEKTASGIIIPETIRAERPQKVKVLAVGPGMTKKDGSRIPMDVKAGDVVLISKYAVDEIEVDKERYYIARQNAILAIINPSL